GVGKRLALRALIAGCPNRKLAATQHSNPVSLETMHAAESTVPSSIDLDTQIALLQRARAAVAEVVYGQEAAVDQLLISLMAGGHVLLEGAPGLGKTLLVRTVGTVCGLTTSRIQFTPDLMPADITGTMVLLQDSTGRTRS